MRRYELKHAVDELAEKEGDGTELISLYIPSTKQIYDVAARLRDELGQSANIKSKQTRTNVQDAISSILARLRYYKAAPENGIAIFCGAVITGNNQNRQECSVIEPPEPIQTYSYRCGSKFEIEPLRDMLADKDVYGLLVIDLGEATWGFLRGTRIECVSNIGSLVPSKQGRGGQSQHRFEQLRNAAIGEFYTKVGNKASETFLSVPDFHDNFKGLIVGGPSTSTDVFLKRSYLHHEIKKKIISIHGVGYTDESGLRELVESSKEDLKNVGIVRQKGLIDQLLKEISRSTGMATYGVNEVRKLLEAGAVATLLLSDDVSHEIAEEFINKAESNGSDVEMISTDFESGNILKTAFGGIAALNRYNVKF